MNIVDTIYHLTKQLFPRGRAFRIPYNSDSEKLYKGLAASETRAYNDALSLLNDILPDNDFFTAQDATDWEIRLGMINNPNVPLADRKLAIRRKMNHPGNIRARQHYLYLQGQLQAAGFNVWVHENRFLNYPDDYKTGNPLLLYGSVGWYWALHGMFLHGETIQGKYYGDMIVNNIDVEKDLTFDIGPHNRCTFFIGGQTLGTFANIPESRRIEFRQLVLQIKPVQAVGYLFLNYT